MHPTENKNIPNHLFAIILTLKGLKSAINASIKKFMQVMFKIIISLVIINKTEIYAKLNLYVTVKQKRPTQNEQGVYYIIFKSLPASWWGRFRGGLFAFFSVFFVFRRC
jgi:hypothetical protein